VFFVAYGGLPDLFAHIDICIKTHTSTPEEKSLTVDIRRDSISAATYPDAQG
jgi:hypothetical protein